MINTGNLKEENLSPEVKKILNDNGGETAVDLTSPTKQKVHVTEIIAYNERKLKAIEEANKSSTEDIHKIVTQNLTNQVMQIKRDKQRLVEREEKRERLKQKLVSDRFETSQETSSKGKANLNNNAFLNSSSSRMTV